MYVCSYDNCHLKCKRVRKIREEVGYEEIGEEA